MRRILALAAVSGLALTGLTGTAAAADSTTQQTLDYVVNEVGIDLTNPTDLTSGIDFVEIKSFETGTTSIDGWQIKACDASGNQIGLTVFQPGTTIDDFVVAGNTAYDNSGYPPPDVALQGSLDPDGGVALLDPTGGGVHGVSFTAPNNPSPALAACLVATNIELSPSPSPGSSLNQSAQRFTNPSGPGFIWQLANPTPRAMN